MCCPHVNVNYLHLHLHLQALCQQLPGHLAPTYPVTWCILKKRQTPPVTSEPYGFLQGTGIRSEAQRTTWKEAWELPEGRTWRIQVTAPVLTMNFPPACLGICRTLRVLTLMLPLTVLFVFMQE